jgi:hypothetical protein
MTAALPRHRLGLSYGKIQRELAAYFGLRVSQGELGNDPIED